MHDHLVPETLYNFNVSSAHRELSELLCMITVYLVFYTTSKFFKAPRKQSGDIFLDKCKQKLTSLEIFKHITMFSLNFKYSLVEYIFIARSHRFLAKVSKVCM